MTMTKPRLSALVVLTSAAVIWLDVITDHYLLFPILFVVPVGISAWFLGRWVGMGIAATLVAVKFYIAVAFEPGIIPFWATIINEGIRLAVLGGLALLLARIAHQKELLENRVHELEGILSICSFCKKIRRPDGAWEQLELYVSERSEAAFSHGVCEDCERIHYGAHVSPGLR